MLNLKNNSLTPVQTLVLMKESCDLCLTPDMHYYVLEREGIREFDHKGACARSHIGLVNLHFRHKHEQAAHFTRRMKKGLKSLVDYGLVPRGTMDFFGEQGAEVWFNVSSVKNRAHCRVQFAVNSLRKDMVLGAVLIAEGLDDTIVGTIVYLNKILTKVLKQTTLGTEDAGHIRGSDRIVGHPP